jgi:tetratricopeptide (TPR) repeat protein
MALKLLHLWLQIIKLKNIPLIQSITIVLLVVSLSGSLFAQRKKKSQKEEPTREQVAQEAEYLFIEAEKLFILKNYSQATEVLNRCLALEPNNDVVYYKLAEINTKTEQLTVAANYIAKALSLNKTNKYYYLLAIDIQTNLGNLKQSATIYEQLIKNVPDSEVYLFNLAATYIYLKDYDQALQTYDRAEKYFGLIEDISFQRQKVFLQQNKVEEAIVEGKRLIAKYPGNSRYVLLLAEVLSSNNKLDEATEQLNALLARDPAFSAARLQLADIYWKQHKFSEFERELKIAFNDQDLNLNAKINTIMKYMVYLPDTNLVSLIPQLTDILVAKHADDSNAYLIAGDVYSTFIEKQLVSAQQVDSVKSKAVTAYAKFVELNPSNYSVWQNLLNLELQLNHQDSLAKHAEQALEFFPNQAWIYLINSIVQLNRKNNKAAAEMLEMGKKRATNNKGLLILFYSYLGDVYNDLEEFEKSDKAYESALELDPLNYTVLNNYSYYLSLRQEKLEQAKKMSTILIRNNPDNNTYLDTYAWVHFALGDYNEAKRIFEKIIASGVDQGVYYDHYGDTLFKLGETEEAVNQWSKAKELDESIENITQKINQRKIIQ